MNALLRKAPPALTLLLATALLAACASGPPTPTVDYNADYDFSAVRKIAFYHDSGHVTGDNPLQLSDIQRDRINSGLAHAVRVHGLELVEDAREADLLLSWHLFTQEKTDVRTWETPAVGVGYAGFYSRYNMYAGYSCWSCIPTRTEVSVHNYTEGTFIVDLIDPALGKSVWRSVIQSRLRSDSLRDQSRINEAAVALLADFPPGGRAAPN